MTIILRLKDADLRHKPSTNRLTLHRASTFLLRNVFELLRQSDQFSKRFLDCLSLFPTLQSHSNKHVLGVKECASVSLTLMTV